jgi:hypothetical protein
MLLISMEMLYKIYSILYVNINIIDEIMNFFMIISKYNNKNINIKNIIYIKDMCCIRIIYAFIYIYIYI